MRRDSKMGSAFELRNSVKRDESMVYCAIALQSSVATRLSHSSSSLSPTSGSEASSDRRSTMSEQLFTASCLQSAVTRSCRSPRRSSRQYVLGCHLSLNKIFFLFIQRRWQRRRTYFFNHYNVLFYRICIHRPSQTQNK